MNSFFLKGIKAMLPIIPGVLPFGLVMGTIATTSGLNLSETMGLNFIVFAGASQLATIELLNQNSSSLSIIITGIIINLRFLLYSAASSEYFKDLPFLQKIYAAYSLTDQSYAVTTAYQNSLETNQEKISFSLGAASAMAVSWHISVIIGVYSGSFIPDELGVDFAVPLSFMALTIPTLISKNHLLVALTSTLLSLILYKIPYNLGLISTAFICIMIANLLIKKDNQNHG